MWCAPLAAPWSWWRGAVQSVMCHQDLNSKPLVVPLYIFFSRYFCGCHKIFHSWNFLPPTLQLYLSTHADIRLFFTTWSCWKRPWSVGSPFSSCPACGDGGSEQRSEQGRSTNGASTSCSDMRAPTEFMHFDMVPSHARLGTEAFHLSSSLM